MSKSLEEIIDIIDESFTKKELTEAWYPLVENFVEKEKKFLKKKKVDTSNLDIVLKKLPKKREFSRMVAVAFCKKEVYHKFLEYLPKSVQIILYELVWAEQISGQKVEDGLKIPLFEKSKSNVVSLRRARIIRIQNKENYVYKLKGEFKVFKNFMPYQYGYETEKPKISLFLAFPLRQLLLNYYDKPAEAAFNPIKTLEKTAYVFESEKIILQEFTRIITYYQQGQIKKTASGKLQVSTLGKMQRKLNLVEFYDKDTDKSLKTLRTHLLALLISTLAENFKETELHKQIKKLITNNYLKRFASTQKILFYLRKHGSIYHQRSIEKDFLDVIKHLPKNQWISIDNFLNYLKYNLIDLSPVAQSVASNSLYYEYALPGERWKERYYIDKTLFDNALVKPSIKGALFMFGAYGLLDLAYNAPDTSVMGLTAYSPFDELQYIRLNDLGAFITGQTKNYDLPEGINETGIKLSEDSLTIIIEKQDLTANLILEPYAERISNNRYKTNYSSFLKGIKTKTDLENKINLFKQSIKVKTPANWELFFKEMRQKINPLNKLEAATVFKIPKDNPELLNLIAKDPVLRKLCLKAEDYHIILTKTNLPKFKKRLQEFGYLMN